MKKKNVLFVVPDGVGMRNYLYSDVITHLRLKATIAFWSTLPKASFKEVIEKHQISDFYYESITLEKEPFLTRFYKESSTYARLLSNSLKVNNKTILNNWKSNSKSIKLKLLRMFSMLLGRWASSNYSRIIALERKSKTNWNRNQIEKYKAKLKTMNLSVLFITHQRVSGLMPICIAAQELGITVICAIYSWDNLPKARLAISADKYLVWSDYMKEEMNLYYPEVKSKDIVVTGTPQFEFYFQEERLLSKNDFAKEYGLDDFKKWICFSGDDVKTSPHDPQYLRDLAESVSSMKEENRPQIIFRRCPVDFSDRYDEVLKEYPDIIPIDPLWAIPDSKSDWGIFYSKMKDVDLLVNLVHHCACVINLGSTMAHDFATLNKPCFYINYDVKKNDSWSVDNIYKYQHFRSMTNLDCVGWFDSKSEIKDKIQLALNKPELIGKDKKKWLELINNSPIDKNSKLIADALLN